MAIKNDLIQSVPFHMERPSLLPYATASQLQAYAIASKDLNRHLTASKVQNVASNQLFSKNPKEVAYHSPGLTTEPSFSFPDVDFSRWEDLTLLKAAAPNPFFPCSVFDSESPILPQNPGPQEFRQQAIETNDQEIESEGNKEVQESSQALLSTRIKAREEDSSTANSTSAIHPSTKKRKQTQKSLDLQAEELSHSIGEDAFEENSKQTGTKKSKSSAATKVKSKAKQRVKTSKKALEQAKTQASLREAMPEELEAAKEAVRTGQNTPAVIRMLYAKHGVKISKEVLELAKKQAVFREPTKEELEAAKEAVRTGQNTPDEIRMLYAQQGVKILKVDLAQAKKQTLQETMAKEPIYLREASAEDFAIAKELVTGALPFNSIIDLFAKRSIYMPMEVLQQFMQP